MINELAPKLLVAPKETTVVMCSWCQKINDKGFEEFAKGVDPLILKELRIVDFRVKLRARKGDVSFSHGICRPHYEQMYAQMGKKAPQQKSQGPPSLIENTELRRQYMKGIFTEEDKQQIQQQPLRERLQKLANIK